MAKHTHFFGTAGSGKTFKLNEKRKESPGALFIDDFDPETPSGYFQANRVLSHLRQGIDVFTAGIAAIRRSDDTPVDNVKTDYKTPAARPFGFGTQLPPWCHLGKHTHFHGPSGSGKSLLMAQAKRNDPTAVFFFEADNLDMWRAHAALLAGQNVYSWSLSPLARPNVIDVKAELPAWAIAQQIPGLKAEIERLKRENKTLSFENEMGLNQIRGDFELLDKNAVEIERLKAENKRLTDETQVLKGALESTTTAQRRATDRLNRVQAALN